MKTSELDGLLQIAIGFPSPEPYSYNKFVFPLMSGEVSHWKLFFQYRS